MSETIRCENLEDETSQKNPVTVDAVRALFADVLEEDLDSIGADADFFTELGGDSVQGLQLCVFAEDRFGVRIPEDRYEGCTTAREFARRIEQLLQGEEQTDDGSPEEVPEAVVPVTRFEDSAEYRQFAERLRLLEGERNPYFICHDSPLRDTSVMDGHTVLNFGSYNYAGMSGRREVTEAAQRAAEHYGTSASGSRLLGGEKPVHRELERAIAAWKHAEDAVVLVGGHSTNVTFVGNFCGSRDLILYDVLDHNSIAEGCRLSDAESRPFPHNDPETLEKILKNVRSRYEKVLIAVEGVYSMDGDIAPIPEYVRIKKEYGCFLMVDEAHSACVLGKTGGGVDEYFGLAPEDIDIKMGTLSKGLGTCGGYLAGKRCVVEYLRYSLPGFVFSVGLSPVLAAASLEAVRLLREDPTIMGTLHRNINAFAEEAKKRNLDIGRAGKTAILPVRIGRDEDAWALSNRLSERGVFVPPAVWPAVPKGKAILRFCVTSEHTPKEISVALDRLSEAADELGITLPTPEAGR